MDKAVYKYKKWKRCLAVAISVLLLAGILPVRAAARVSSSTVNDPYFRYQWALRNDGTLIYSDAYSRARKAVAGIDAKIEQAWNYLGNYQNPEPVIVAVVDTGVDYTHPDLKDSIWKNPGEVPDDGIDNDKNGFVDDVYGWNFYDDNNKVYDKKRDNAYSGSYFDDHGTHCAGSIVAARNNDTGIAGIASGYNVQVMIVKALGGSMGIENGTNDSVVRAIRYAEQMGADICNLSLGGYRDDAKLTKIIRKSKMLFVCACGNEGSNNDRYPVYPATLTYNNVISVAGLTPGGRLASYSNYGVNTVTMAAPGTKIASTSVGGDYQYLSGTSMAAPVVSGVAALLYAYHPGITADVAKQVLVSNVTKMDQLADQVSSGGMVNAFQALASDFHLPQIETEQEETGNSITVTVRASTFGGAQLEKLLWASGRYEYDFFQNGMVGNALTDDQFRVKKTGVYTVYALNRNGLQNVAQLKCQVGTAPKIACTVRKGKKTGNRVGKIRVSDAEKNLKAVYYASGSHKKSEFSNRETGKRLKLHSSGKGNITGRTGENYTIYAVDRAGNQALLRVRF